MKNYKNRINRERILNRVFFLKLIWNEADCSLQEFIKLVRNSRFNFEILKKRFSFLIS